MLVDRASLRRAVIARWTGVVGGRTGVADVVWDAVRRLRHAPLAVHTVADLARVLGRYAARCNERRPIHVPVADRIRPRQYTNSVFCPGFQKGRASIVKKGTFSAVFDDQKGTDNCR